MSEAELHLIRTRMRGGVLNKAKRGELATPLPFGFVYDDEGRVVLDPDQQIQQVIRSLFDTFRRVGSAFGVTKEFRRPRQEWHTLILDAHQGYIAWQEYEDNLHRLRENAQIKGVEKRSAAREGPSVLQGLAICGICGRRMTVGYRKRKAGLAAD